MIQPADSLLSSLPSSKDVAEVEEREDPEPEQGFAERLAAAAHQPSDADDGGEADIAMEIDEDEDEEEEIQEQRKDDLAEALLAGKSTVKLVQVWWHLLFDVCEVHERCVATEIGPGFSAAAK